MQRILIVYNPRSSRHDAVVREVLEPARELTGVMTGKYEVRASSVEENITALSKIIQNGDWVIAAGGDGTATIGLNGIMQSEKEAVFIALGYGNFNDLARMLGGWKFEELVDKIDRDARTHKIWPLEVVVDGKHWRYAGCYATIGMFAESTALFDAQKVRRKLIDGGKSRPLYSIVELVVWYFKNRQRKFMPAGKLNGVQFAKGTTDYLAMNGTTMARWMHGGGGAKNKTEFYSGIGRLGNFCRLMVFMMRSIFGRVPGRETRGDVLEFMKSGVVMVQAEGEYQKFSGVRKIEVRKAERSILVLE